MIIELKNRIQKENKKTLELLMNNRVIKDLGNEKTQETPDNLYFLTYQTNSRAVEPYNLKQDFGYILCRFYHYLYGSQFVKKKELQYKFQYIIERGEKTNKTHIHMILETPTYGDAWLFYAYTANLFKTIQKKSCFDARVVYDLEYLKETYFQKDENKIDGFENDFQGGNYV